MGERTVCQMDLADLGGTMRRSPVLSVHMLGSDIADKEIDQPWIELGPRLL